MLDWLCKVTAYCYCAVIPVGVLYFVAGAVLPAPVYEALPLWEAFLTVAVIGFLGWPLHFLRAGSRPQGLQSFPR
jgi:hypothetical protein